jgi:glycosyltransferase involved in cell wall biosynthesis
MYKTLFILHYPPPIHGAAMMGQYIKNSQLINSQLQTKYINLSTSITVEEIGKNGLKKWLRYVNLLFKTFYFGLFWRPKLVYISLSSHGGGLIKDSLVVFICRLLGLKHVFHFHNKGVKKYAKTKTGKFLYPLVFKKAEIILLSALLYEDLKKFVPIERVYFCANGIPKIETQSINKNIQENKPIHLLFLSNLIASKGVWEVLEACCILKNKKLPFQCTLAGGIGDINVSEIQNFISNNNLYNEIQYIGKVSGQNKFDTFQKADVFLLPTFYHNECFPLVILEAMQFGIPIISTHEGAIPEMIEEGINGFLIPKNNAMAIASSIEKYIENKNLILEQGKNNKLKYQEKYQLEVFEKNLIKILNKLAQKSN